MKRCFLPLSSSIWSHLDLGLILFILILMGQSCQFRGSSKDDVLLARAFDKRLYVSEIQKSIPVNSSPADSLLVQNALIERWIKENVMMHEAEKNIPAGLEIDRLVKDYKSSLIMHQYEKSVVESSLDTFITTEELEEYYNDNKSQYILESIIVRCRLIKLSKDVPQEVVDKVKSLWDSTNHEDQDTLAMLGGAYSSTSFLGDSLWYKLELVSQELPQGAINAKVIRNNKLFQLTNDDYFYFLKILEIKDKTEIAPLAYIQEQASLVILHKRKIHLLEKLRDDLYEQASSRNYVKLFTK